MNQAVNAKKLLEEIKSNAGTDGVPSFENNRDGFIALGNYVTEWMMDRYNICSPGNINWGYCFIWAYLVWSLWPHGGVTFKTSTGHVVVKWNNLYFDSENPNGTKNVNNIDGFGQGRAAKHVDINIMAMYWSRCGTRAREFRTLVRKTCPSLYNYMRSFDIRTWKNTDAFDSYSYINEMEEVS